MPVAVAASPSRSRVLRSSARPLHAVLHRDVGALQLLRHARVPHALHGGAGIRRRARIRRRGRRVDLRHLHRQRLGRGHCSAASSPIGSSGSTAACSIGGIIIALGHFALGVQGAALLLRRARPDRRRHRSAQAERRARSSDRSTRPGDARRDAGFSIFYMGINLGALFGPLIAGYLAQRVDWHLGFACAGVGMTLGLIQYVVGRKHLASADRRVRRRSPRGRPHRPSSRIHRRRMEADGRDRHLLPRRRPLLGRLRAGRLDAQPVRRSLHPDRDCSASPSPRHGSSRCSRCS